MTSSDPLDFLKPHATLRAAMLELALTHRSSGALDDAESWLRKAVAVDGRSVIACGALGQFLYRTRGDKDGAEDMFDAAMAALDEVGFPPCCVEAFAALWLSGGGPIGHDFCLQRAPSPSPCSHRRNGKVLRTAGTLRVCAPPQGG